MRLILASASPRRAELLRAAGYAFTVQAAEVDERPLPGEPPAGYVCRLAREKAAAVAATVDEGAAAVVLAADTTVVVDGHILEKPADRADAARMLRLLSGRSHEVLTGICVGRVSDAGPGRLTAETFPVELDRTTVWFAVLERDEIADYLDTDEWTDKAGAYGIQGFASRFIPRIEGSYTNVVGLPVARVHTLLKSLKIPNFR